MTEQLRNSNSFILRSLLSILLTVVLVFGLRGKVRAEEPVWQHAVVAADHPAASEAGAEILRRGGNVVDAAVATSFALSVVRPASCGIGGGGFMLIWDASAKQATALDYRETAPAAATADMFREDGSSDTKEAASVRGGKAVATPGTVAGLCYAAEHYGSLPLSVLLEPAIRLATEGVPVDEHDINVQRSTLAKLSRYAGYQQRFALLKKLYLNDGRPWGPGDRFYSPQKSVLERIAAEGPKAFYEGDVAAALVRAVHQENGILTTQDLSRTAPVVRQPLVGSFHDATVMSMPPASSGGVALLQTVQSLEHWERQAGRQLSSLGQNSADYVHVVTEAMKHAFADRAEYLGDTDFVKVPLSRLLSEDYARQIASRIDLQHTLPAERYGRFFAAQDGGTSHFSVIDKAGNAVACTETINLTFGSFVVVPDYGIVLNNQIDDFAARPGEPNAFGLMQSRANAIAAGKKPLSSMTPTIVIRDGQATFVAGASGGPRIISATIQATLNHLVFQKSPAEAVAAPRFHHQWFPNELLLEPALFEVQGNALRQRGHLIKRNSSLAASQAASRNASGLHGGSDPRKHGTPAGF
ncbi:MAG: gamma-glutamyltransferase [Fuerstiella sp.]